MQPSSTMCRAQEAQQRELASNAVLPNVRRIATLAAAAWAKEALAADKREERRRLRRLDAGAAPAPRLEQPLDDDRLFSENPDRGFADVDPIRRLGALPAA
ncbi:hypothetical protein [Sphingomonas sp. DT-204]|uniref:hypothetical protein n=1 Tax=Sphingomonas sp. DT-204 TaxID=3396166 RepID=UPI003F1B9769